MRLASGTNLGAYQIVAPLGVGGMGEVYRARDGLLKREVAIKVIPETYASDPERLRRFQFEAEAAASLNHPNIVTVHHVGRDNGISYIVAELLQGETLRERLRSGPIPVRVATDFGAQIARGLAAAHEQGIVHRDLKPENIFVTRDGRIKILDFGLAKLTEPPSGLEPGRNDSEPTATHVTEPGMAVGTAAYMSPEQVRSRPVDFHADIFALGAVLYEMLAGKRAFAKPTAAETMTAILNEDPLSLSQSRRNIPPGLHRVILRCLEKKPEQRFQSASDLAFALEALSDPSDSGTLAISPAKRSRRTWILVSACAIAIATAVIVWLRLPPAVPVVESITQITDDGEPKFGPHTDGTRIYFNEGGSGGTYIAQVSVRGGRTGPVEDAPTNYWILGVTPDGGEMLLNNENDVVAVSLPAGQPRRVLDRMSTYDASLLPDGRIIYSTRGEHRTSDVMLAERDGSNPRKIRSFDTFIGMSGVSRDGQQVLICAEQFALGGCKVQSIHTDGADVRTILDWHGAYTDAWFTFSHDDRYVLFNQAAGSQTDIWALPIRAGFLHDLSRPIRLTSGPLSYSNPVPSPDGKRIYVIGTKLRAELTRYEPKTGQFLPWRPGLSAIETQFSADGKWMVYLTYPDLSVWRSRIDGTEQMQLTFPPMKAYAPRFSPDGNRIAFSGTINRTEDTYVIDSSGGQLRKIADRAGSPEWSPDGSIIAVNSVGTCLVNLATGKISRVSDDTSGAKFVDANTLVAFNNEKKKFVTFNISNNQWSELVSASLSTGLPALSPDRKFLYFPTGGKAWQIQRIAFSTRKIETIGELRDYIPADYPGYGDWDFAVASDGSLIFSSNISSVEIYALNMRWP
jgi:serine/threonine protein kinase